MFKTFLMMNKVLTFVSVAFVVIQSILAIIIVFGGGVVPTHWNIFGETDAYSNAYDIIILLIINVLSFVLLLWLSNHPEFCNFPRPFRNKEVAHKNMTRMLRWLGLYVSAIFLYITIGVLTGSLSIAILLLILGCASYTMVVGIVRLSKS